MGCFTSTRALLSRWLHRLRLFHPKRHPGAGQKLGDSPDSNENAFYVPSPDDYPSFPPPPPCQILDTSAHYWRSISGRKFLAPQGHFEDTSLFALYRFYELVILDQVIEYRNALEAFWRHRDWAVSDIPDPQDEDPERYAFLAGCTYLLSKSFNARVELGLRRDNPPLITPEEAEAARQVPAKLRPWEEVPAWAMKVASLQGTLRIPTHEGVILESEDDTRADPDFKAKNILLWTPHIYFT